MLPRFEGDSNCVHGGGDNWVLPKSKRNLEIHFAKKKPRGHKTTIKTDWTIPLAACGCSC